MTATHNPTLEENLCAKVVQGGDFQKVDGVADPHFFVYPPFAYIWSVCEEINDAELVISKESIIAGLQKKSQLGAIMIEDGEKVFSGREALEFLGEKDVSSFDLETMAFQLRDALAARMTLALSDRMRMDAENGLEITEILARADMQMGKIGTLSGTKSSAIKDSNDVAFGISEIFAKGVSGEHGYLETGLAAWDDYTEGLYGGRVYIVAGTSGSGKSTLAQNIAFWLSVRRNIVDSNDVKRTDKVMGGIISLEMDSNEVGGRLLRMCEGIRYQDIEKGRVQDHDKFEKSLIEIKDASVLYDCSTQLNLPMLRAKMRKMAALGAKYIIIDQLDQIDSGLENSGYSEKDYITYRIKSYAREFDVAVILCHQMNKSADNITRKEIFNVSLADLKESGQNAVDCVAFVRRDATKAGLVWVKVRQGHDMPTNIAYLAFNINRNLYEDTQHVPPEMEEE